MHGDEPGGLVGGGDAAPVTVRGPFAACPHCRAVFRVPAAALRAARGRARCGACGAAFDALDTLADEPAEALALAPGPAGDAPVMAAPVPRLVNEAATADASGYPFPEPPRRPRRGWWWALAALALLLALAAQGVILWQQPLRARVPALAPWLDAACRYLPCTRPPVRIDGISVIGRDVREHPLLADTILVNVALRNDAPAPRAAPLLQLVLYDRLGQPVAQRRLAPADYLAPGTPRRLAPGESVFASVEATGPVANAAGFELRLLPPRAAR